jgi:hypothetical protein
MTEKPLEIRELGAKRNSAHRSLSLSLGPLSEYDQKFECIQINSFIYRLERVKIDAFVGASATDDRREWFAEVTSPLFW